MFKLAEDLEDTISLQFIAQIMKSICIDSFNDIVLMNRKSIYKYLFTEKNILNLLTMLECKYSH